ncbi:agmatinase, mitochondrial-like isoform X2 [Trematomus bernacchii]|uniref:agmatinase, mitochondrial-like isoform X2 n=1 Tax=Trematomus bernacchii TaxID=40690 RepID=UPI00146DD92E|nr:agmatinase, mitochondrial-like isoform X2 [Trematomus bernacchii]
METDRRKPKHRSKKTTFNPISFQPTPAARIRTFTHLTQLKSKWASTKMELSQCTKFGPRQIRVESAMLRSFNSGTRVAPYDSLMVADIGDVNVNLYDLKDTCTRIREFYRRVLSAGCIPLTMGGDHTIAYPILQAVAEKHSPVGLVHVDAHADTSDVVLGERIGHGTPFRRCVEEGLLDCSRVVQIGLRGSGYSADSYAWSRAQVEECWFKSLAPLMEEVRGQMGGGPVYLSFDIDALDPGFAPGTGTPEIAGLTPIQVDYCNYCLLLYYIGSYLTLLYILPLLLDL